MSQQEVKDYPSPQDAKIGRPGALDDEKRGRICGMIAQGASRREAARAVGCHVSTITRTIERDAEFARQIGASDLAARARPLQAMNKAIDRSWRAAAWMLERTRPEEFSRRRPHTYTHRDVREVVDRILEHALPRMPAEADREEISQIADDFIEQLDHPPAAAPPSNPLLDMQRMEEEFDEHRRQREEEARAKAAAQRAAEEEAKAQFWAEIKARKEEEEREGKGEERGERRDE